MNAHGQLGIMQINKEKTKAYIKATFDLLALEIIGLKTMSDDEHSESEFYYPDEFDFQEDKL